MHYILRYNKKNTKKFKVLNLINQQITIIMIQNGFQKFIYLSLVFLQLNKKLLIKIAQF
jgi:hypothetical protein